MQWNDVTIKELRTSAGLTQEALAHRLGVSVFSVSRWERGLSRPRSKAHLRGLEGLRRTVE